MSQLTLSYNSNNFVTAMSVFNIILMSHLPTMRSFFLGRIHMSFTAEGVSFPPPSHPTQLSLQINRSLKSQQSSMRGVRIFFIEYKIRFYANAHTCFHTIRVFCSHTMCSTFQRCNQQKAQFPIKSNWDRASLLQEYFHKIQNLQLRDNCEEQLFTTYCLLTVYRQLNNSWPANTHFIFILSW